MSAAEDWQAERDRLRDRLANLSLDSLPLAHRAPGVRLTFATEADVPRIRALVQAAFAEYEATFDPPAGALRETEEATARSLTQGGALLAWRGEEAVGTVQFRLEPVYVYLGRLAVLPQARGRGVARMLISCVEQIARLAERDRVHLGTRLKLTRNVALYQRLGYQIVNQFQHPRGADVVVWLEKTLD